MSPAPTSSRSAAQIWTAVRLAVAAAFVVLVWRQRWIGDDGFINLRVAANVLDGFGPVFNVGERAEAYTSALWLAALVAGGALTQLRLEDVAVALGVCCSALAALIVALGAGTGASRRASLPFGLVTFAAIPVAWDYGTSALETPMSLLWLAASYGQLGHIARAADADRAVTAPRAIAAACTIGLAPLVRPDLALFGAAFLGALGIAWLRAPGRTAARAAVLLLAAGALPLSAQLFRMGYFAAMVPNTAYAKEAFASYWSQGGHYFENFFGKYLLAIPLALTFLVAGLPAAVRTLRARGWALSALNAATLLAGAGAITYIVRVGGDFMHGRMFLHGLFGLLLPVMLVPVDAGSRASRWATWAAFVAVVGWAGTIATSVRMGDNEWSIGDERGWYTREAGVYNAVHIEDYAAFMFHREGVAIRRELERACGRALGVREVASGCDVTLLLDQDFGRTQPHRTRQPVAPGAVAPEVGLVAARVPIGIIGLLTGPAVHLVDRAGLADPIHARLELEHRSRPGHEKIAHDVWIAARYAAPADSDDPRVAAARRALACGALAELRTATTAPLGARRFFDNVHRARAFHTLRIPTDPFAAEERFCGVAPPRREGHGGGGGLPFEVRCGSGSGVRALSAWTRPEGDLTAVAVACDRAAATRWISTRFGRGAGRPATLACPAGSDAVGLTGGFDHTVRSIGLVCGAGSQASDVAGSGGVPFSLVCPEGTLLRGVGGRSGDLVDRLEIVCH